MKLLIAVTPLNWAMIRFLMQGHVYTWYKSVVSLIFLLKCFSESNTIKSVVTDI